MAQPWSAVEQSQQYQAFPKEEQQAAKQQYFSDVVSKKPEFIDLPDEEKQAASSQFLGTQESKQMTGALAQGGKGIYDVAHQIPVVRQFMDLNPQLADLAGEVPEAKGLGDKLARMAGQGIGLIPAFAGGEALAGGKLIGGALGIGAQKTAGDLQDGKSLPEAATSGAIDAAGTYVGGKLLNAAGEAIGGALKPVSEKISDTIGDLYNKAVKPTIVKGNANMLAKSSANIETGVRAIINNKDNLSLGDEGVQHPETLAHTSEAIEQTKNDTFNKYNEMQKQATGKGVTINGQGLAQSLQPIIDDKALEVVSPQTKEYASKLFERLQNAGEMTPQEAQDMIKGFNGRLKAYYRNPSPDQYGNTAVDALVANNARKSLDDAISNSVGEGYQDLKHQYGALSSMEKDVSRATQRSSNYQNKGLLDFSDIFTGEQVARGILTGNPAEVASGVGGRLIKEYYKRLNNPDANIKQMFSKVGQYMEQEGKPSLVDNISAATQKAKETLGGLADAIPSRLGMAGKAGSNAHISAGGEVPAEIVSGKGGAALPPPQKPIMRQDRMLPSPRQSGQSTGETIIAGPPKPTTEDPNGFLAEARQRLANNKGIVNIGEDLNGKSKEELNQSLDYYKKLAERNRGNADRSDFRDASTMINKIQNAINGVGKSPLGLTAATGAGIGLAMGAGKAQAKGNDYDFIAKFEGGKQIRNGKLISNGGVEQPTLDQYNKENGSNLKMDSMKADDIKSVRDWYIHKQGYDKLGPATRKVMADYAYHFGPNRANKDLQRVIGSPMDGRIGQQSIAKASKIDDKTLANKILNEQTSYMKTKNNYAKNANGWHKRINEIRSMINNGE